MIRIATVVVTFNRRKLLQECLNAILKQSKKPNSIIIIDNNSEDGTKEMLENEFLEKSIFDYVRLNRNTGSAGGQYAGIKRAYEQGFDWIWCMDDDTIPKKTTLEELIKTKDKLYERGEKNIGFICSRVVSPKNKEMNVPTLNKTPKGQYSDQFKHLDLGAVKVNSATFVSILFSNKTVKNKGLPLKKMFIWGEDTEYTKRISNNLPCYIAGKSVAIHKRNIEKPLNIIFEKEPGRIKNYYHFYKNNLYISKKYNGFISTIVNYLSKLYLIFKVIMQSKNYSLLKIKVIVSGVLSSITLKFAND